MMTFYLQIQEDQEENLYNVSSLPDEAFWQNVA